MVPGRVSPDRFRPFGSVSRSSRPSTPFPLPAHRTGRADFPHPALGPGSSCRRARGPEHAGDIYDTDRVVDVGGRVSALPPRFHPVFVDEPATYPPLDELLQLRYVVENVRQATAVRTIKDSWLVGSQAQGWVTRGMSIPCNLHLRHHGCRQCDPSACDTAHAFRKNLVREPDAGNPQVRFDERGGET